MTNPNAATSPLFVPVAHVVDRIVKQTMDAVEASRTNETPNIKSWTDAAVKLVNEHPSKNELVSWLAIQALEDGLSSESTERGLNYAMEFGSPLIKATEADEEHSQVMQEEFEETRRRIAKDKEASA